MQKLSNNNFSDIKLEDNSLMFNSFKKIKIQNKSTHEKNMRHEFKGLQDSKLYSKYMDLNLQSRIMKEYPINFLEIPANKQKEGSENIIFESIMLLQNKVYNPIFQMFFENQ